MNEITKNTEKCNHIFDLAELHQIVTPEDFARRIAAHRGEQAWPTDRTGEKWRVGKRRPKGSISVKRGSDGKTTAKDFNGGERALDVFAWLQSEGYARDFCDAMEQVAAWYGVTPTERTEKGRAWKREKIDALKEFADLIEFPSEAVEPPTHVQTIVPTPSEPENRTNPNAYGKALTAKGKRGELLRRYGARLVRGLHHPTAVAIATARGIAPEVLMECVGIGFAAEPILRVPGFSDDSAQPNSFYFWDEKTVKRIAFDPETGKRCKGDSIRHISGGGALEFAQILDDEPKTPLFFVEGEFDVIAMRAMGLDAIASHKGETVASYMRQRTIVLAYDADEAGRKFTEAAQAVCPRAIDIGTLWGEGGDPNDFLKAKGASAARAAILDAVDTAKKEAKTPYGLEYASPRTMAALMNAETTKNGLYKSDMAAIRAVLTDKTCCALDLIRDAFDGESYIKDLAGGDGAWHSLEDHKAELIARLGELGFSTSARNLLKADLDYALDLAERKTDTGEERLRARLKAMGAEQWDGVPRIEQTFTHYAKGTNNPEYLRAVARYFWTGLAKRAITPSEVFLKQTICLVGKQSLGKTPFVEALGMGEFFGGSVSLSGLDTARRNDIIRRMKGRLVFELAEGGGISKADRNAVKDFLSTTKDEFIEKYQTKKTSITRRCGFVMTTNDHDFLNDPTGADRYYPIDVIAIDLAAWRRDVPQMWAEALATLETNGGRVEWEAAASCPHTQEARAEHEERHPWHDEIGRYIGMMLGKRFSATNLLVMHIFKGETYKAKRQDLRTVSEILRQYEAQGIIRHVKVRGERLWAVETLPVTEAVAQTDAVEQTMTETDAVEQTMTETDAVEQTMTAQTMTAQTMTATETAQAVETKTVETKTVESARHEYAEPWVSEEVLKKLSINPLDYEDDGF